MKITMADPTHVHIYNPLPLVLAHFVLQLADRLESAGRPSICIPSVNGEVGRDLRAKALALGNHVRIARRHVESGAPLIVAWPLLGWLEMPLWRHSTNGSLIVVHDPEPLVRQHGLSQWTANLSARLAGPRWPHIVTMSPEAHAIAVKHFDPKIVHLAPHPMITPPTAHSADHGRVALVLGQYKPSRDIEAMAAIAEKAQNAGWNLVVAGRGWPEIPGWTVHSRFLSEDDFRTLLATARVLVLPYRHYFQSGVALRALESGIPVVGRSSGFLRSVLGEDFPGSVDDWGRPQSWLDALEAAVAGRESQLQNAGRYSQQGASEWRALADLAANG